MFCPSCGNNQADGKKFCTTCGTNLGLVSAALSQPTAYQPPSASFAPDAAIALAAAQARYRSQLAAAFTRGAPGAGLLVAALIFGLAMPLGISIWIIFGLVIGGISSLGKGLGTYFAARAELQAAEITARLPQPPATFAPPAPSINATPTTPGLTPPSVAEHTTRHLG